MLLFERRSRYLIMKTFLCSGRNEEEGEREDAGADAERRPPNSSEFKMN